MANSGTHSARLLLPLLGGALICLLATVAGALRFGDPLYFFSDVKGHSGALQGSMTAINGFLLVSAGTCLLLYGRQRTDLSRPVRWAFHGFAALLLFLAFDEVVMFHEWATKVLIRLDVPSPLGIDQDLYIFVVYGLFGAACLAPMMPALLDHRRTRLLLCWMLAFAVASQALDFVPWDGLTRAQQNWVGPLEESFKTMAVLSASWATWLLLIENKPEQPAPRETAVRPPHQSPSRTSRRMQTADSERED